MGNLASGTDDSSDVGNTNAHGGQVHQILPCLPKALNFHRCPLVNIPRHQD
jgi:hypothetical protein